MHAFTEPLAILAAAAVADSAAMPPNAATAVRVVGDPVADPTPATLKLYAGDWARFVTWCREQNRPSLPASSATLAAYLGSRHRTGRIARFIEPTVNTAAWRLVLIELARRNGV